VKHGSRLTLQVSVAEQWLTEVALRPEKGIVTFLVHVGDYHKDPACKAVPFAEGSYLVEG
jgi:hypothetical protein